MFLKKREGGHQNREIKQRKLTTNPCWHSHKKILYNIMKEKKPFYEVCFYCNFVSLNAVVKKLVFLPQLSFIDTTVKLANSVSPFKFRQVSFPQCQLYSVSPCQKLNLSILRPFFFYLWNHCYLQYYQSGNIGVFLYFAIKNWCFCLNSPS